MLKNILIHLLISAVVCLSVALLLDQFTYCDSMCGIYYFSAGTFLFPLFFLLGLPVPIGLKKYPKENIDHSAKRTVCMLLGFVGMLSVFCWFILSFYSVANNKNVTNELTTPLADQSQI